MRGDASHARTDRVAERRRAVALARHFREAEGLSIAEIGGRLGRSPAIVKAYFYDATGEKARAVKARYFPLRLAVHTSVHAAMGHLDVSGPGLGGVLEGVPWGAERRGVGEVEV